MSTSSNLYNSEWLALVFKNRNQNYGAYVLRKESDRIIAKSLFIAGSIFIGLFVSPYIFAKQELKDVSAIDQTQHIVDISEIKPITPLKPKTEEPVKEQAKPEPAPKVEVQSKKFVSNIKLVEEPVVDEMPKLSELENSAISNVTQSGTDAKGNAPAAIGEGGHGTAPAGETNGGVDDGIYNAASIESYPEFPGGMEAFSKFIQKNLRYPYMAQENNVQGKVFLSFVVEKDGAITDVKVVRGVGYGCDEEAVRVIKKSPKWKPGIQNARTVRVRYNMPINYVMQ